MEAHKGLKSILLDVLGLPVPPAAAQTQGQDPATPALVTDDAAAHAAAQHSDAGQQQGTEQTATTSDAPAALGGAKTAKDDAFAARLSSISHQFALDSAAAKDAQLSLQEAHRQAHLKETEVLAAADAAYTPGWRRTGLPSKASQLQLNDVALSDRRLLNPAAIISQQRAYVQKEVLQPPAVFTYCDKTAAPHFLATTGNQKVRETITAARAAAKSPKPLIHTQPAGTASPKAKQQAAAARSSPSPDKAASQSSPQQTQRQSRAVAGQQHTFNRTAAWSKLPAEEAAAKMAAAAARYKAMAAIMTPEQRELEEKIIKSTYQRLSYLCNPRFAQESRPGPGSLPLKGTSTAHRRHAAAKTGSKSTVQQRQPGLSPVVEAAAAGINVVPGQGVLFDAYEPGNAYFQTVQLQNVGTVMRQLRLLPPSSRYFQISFPRFPLESSALAPGMCAEVDVCFMPDSLGDYQDAFTVDTPAGSFDVQLIGQRPHPLLMLPPVLEVGNVLVGNQRSRTFEFVNNGGDARFLVLTAQQWGTTLQAHGYQQDTPLLPTQPDAADSAAISQLRAPPYSSAVHAAAAAAQAHSADGFGAPAMADAAMATAGPFSIGPAFLDLPAGAARVLTVDFSPEQQGPQAAEFVLLCDNCTAHSLRVEGVGEQVQVQLVGLDDRQWLPQDAQMPLWFGQVCPGASSMRRLRVFNSTDLPFPFQWTVDDPQPTAATLDPQHAAAFAVTPAAGVLQANSEQDFTVRFSPLCVTAHSAGLTLAVQRSGDAGLVNITQWGQAGTSIIDLTSTAPLSTTATLQAQHDRRQLAASVQPCLQSSTGDCSNAVVAAAVGHEHGLQAPAIFGLQSAAVQGLWPGDSAWQPVAQLPVEGVGNPVVLTAQPATLRVPGDLTVGDEACLPLELHNNTAAAAHYSIVAVQQAGGSSSAAAAAAEVTVEPCSGVVPAHGTLKLSAHFKALAAGSHRQAFVVKVQHGPEQQLQAFVDVRQVKVVPAAPVLDFGVLCVGASATQELQLTSAAANSSSWWHLKQQHDGQQVTVPPTVLSFQPCQGSLGPKASCRAAITVTGTCEGEHRLLVCVTSRSRPCSCCCAENACRDADGDAAVSKAGSCNCSVEYVQVLVRVSSPTVALSRYRLAVQHAFAGVPQHHCVTMTNTSSLPLTFSWAVGQLEAQQCIKLQQQLRLLSTSSTDASSSSSSEAGSLMTLHSSSSSSSTAGAPTQAAEAAAGQMLLQTSPATGHLEPGESVQLQLYMQPTAVGPVALLCCCQVPAMSKLVGLLLTADVGGPQVQYRIMRVQDLQQLQPQTKPQRHSGRRSGSPGRHRASSPAGRRSSSPNGRPSSTTAGHRASSPPGHRASSPMGHASGSAAGQRAGSPAHMHSSLASRVVSAASGGAGSSQKQLAQFGDSSMHEVDPTAAGGKAGPAGALGAVMPAVQQAPAVLSADFGVVGLHQPAELLLQVVNLTSIPSTVKSWMGHFVAQPSAGTPGSNSTTSNSSHHSSWPNSAGAAGLTAALQDDAASVTGRAASPDQGTSVYHADSSSRRGSSYSPALSAHRRNPSPQRKGQSLASQPVLASSIACKLSRTDPCTYTGSRTSSSATIPANDIVSTLSSITSTGSTLPHGTAAAMMDASAAAGPSAASSSTSTPGSTGSTVALKGPFRAFAGNAMMAARQAAAAASAALGSGSAGCAVQLLPDACHLPGWGSCVMRLQAFNNLPGTYVDTLFVQVGDLPPQRIPTTLLVVGSPLVLNKHRVQRQASEVLHTLIWHQQQLLRLPQAVPGLDACGTAAQGSSQGSALAAPSSAGCSSNNSSSSSGSSSDAERGSKVSCSLDFGVVPAGMQVQQTFFVSNPGPLPMELIWGWLQQADSNSASDSSSSDNSPGLASASPGPVELLPVSCDGADDSALGVHADSDSLLSTHEADDSLRPDSSSSCKVGTAAGKAPDAAAAAGLGKKGATSAPGGTAAALTPAGGKAAAAAPGKARPVVSAGQAPAPAEKPGRRQSTSTDKGPEQQQQQPLPAEQAAAAGPDPAGTGTEHSGAVDDSNKAAAATAAAARAGPNAAAADELRVVSSDALLPPGGPSSLLQTLQQAKDSQGATHGCEASAASTVNGSAGVNSSAQDLFSISPCTCIIPAGQQQQFVVTFSSSEARCVRNLVLQGVQTFHSGAAGGQQGDGSSSGSLLRLHLLPSAGPASTDSSRQGGGTGGETLIRCHITGGFHPHAGPPPRPLPALTAALSALVVSPQLDPADPDCFRWSCTTTNNPGTHPSFLQTATLCNDTGCPQVFRLSCEGCFKLVSTVPSVRQDVDTFRGMLGSARLPAKHGSTATADTMPSLLLLPPGESVDVTIRFEPPYASQEGTQSGAGTGRSRRSIAGQRSSVSGGGAPPSARGQAQAAACLPEASTTAQYEGALRVTFSTGQQQVLPLQATVEQPELLVSCAKSPLDFGAVHPAAPRTLELVITNPTGAEAAWQASIQPLAPRAAAEAGQQLGKPVQQAAASAFTVLPHQGVLAGRGLGMPKQARLQVVFVPFCSGVFGAELRLGVRGGRAVSVVLMGQGVHAEGAELRAAYDL